jgi:hypothetical protein
MAITLLYLAAIPVLLFSASAHSLKTSMVLHMPKLHPITVLHLPRSAPWNLEGCLSEYIPGPALTLLFTISGIRGQLAPRPQVDQTMYILPETWNQICAPFPHPLLVGSIHSIMLFVHHSIGTCVILGPEIFVLDNISPRMALRHKPRLLVLVLWPLDIRRLADGREKQLISGPGMES